MLNLNVPSIDQAMSTDGVWCEFSSKISFLIGRDGIDGFVRAVKASYRQNEYAINSGTLSDDEDDKQMVDILVEYILLGWKGLKDGNKELPYTPENAKKLLLDKRYFELRKWIILQSKNMENFREQEIKKPKSS